MGLAILSLPGCVHRRMTIRSNPPGAMAYVDGYEIGSTPVSANFTYYGTRQIRLVKDGCETLNVMQKVPTPWYQVPPLDFFSENLWLGTIKDHPTFTYQMSPQMVVPTDQLLERANGLRAQAQTSTVPAAAPLNTEPGTPALPEAVPGPPPVGTPPPSSDAPPPWTGTPIPPPPVPPSVGTPIPQPFNAPPPGSYPVHPLPR